MRVAIEAAPLSLSSGGLLRYTTELSLALARCFTGDELFLVSDQPFDMPRDAPPNLKRGGGPRNAAERRWWLWGLTRELGAARLRPDSRPRFRGPFPRPAPQRPHSARSLALDGSALAARRVANITRIGFHPFIREKILREEFLSPLGMSAHELALALRVPATRINDIVIVI